MTRPSHFQQSYYRGQLRALLYCNDAGCTLDLSEPQPSMCDCYRLEILLQPVDAHGWPHGQARLLYEAAIPMSPRIDTNVAVGFLRLPFRLTEDVLSRCHLRLQCIRIVPHHTTDRTLPEQYPGDPHDAV
ncbi:MAG: hypothetical protein JSS49_08405 [Planctomycetes bacterium]|nr:hypothetical protein [Planctomycetota bacterium]